MARRTDLATALHQAGTRPAAPVSPRQEEPSAAPAGTRPPSRQGKKTVAGHFDPAVSRQLRELALVEDTSVQALLREALNDLFVKRGRAPIA